jgi:putative acetyltransferase
MVPDDLVIRSERPDDHAAIARVVAEAFESPVEAALVDRIRSSPQYVAEMALVAEDAAGTIVGHVMISGAALRLASGQEHPIVMLSPLAVTPTRHRCGVGSALVRAALAIADQRGEPFVVLEGSPKYYGRLGFVAAATHGITMPLPDWAPAEAAQIATLSRDDPSLAGFVVYPPAFDGVD